MVTAGHRRNGAEESLWSPKFWRKMVSIVRGIRTSGPTAHQQQRRSYAKIIVFYSLK